MTEQKKVVAKKVTKKVTKKAASAEKVTKKTASAEKVTAEKSENTFEQLQALLQDNLSGLSSEKAEELAKNVWLAGLGAYSRTFSELAERREEMQDKYQEINTEGQKVFEDLVTRGKVLQGDAEKVMQQGRETLEERVEELKHRFGGGLSSFVDIPTRLREAAEKIEDISERLQKKK